MSPILTFFLICQTKPFGMVFVNRLAKFFEQLKLKNIS